MKNSILNLLVTNTNSTEYKKKEIIIIVEGILTIRKISSSILDGRDIHPKLSQTLNLEKKCIQKHVVNTRSFHMKVIKGISNFPISRKIIAVLRVEIKIRLQYLSRIEN